MPIEELIKRGILIPPTEDNTCPRCKGQLSHGFGIKTNVCNCCGYVKQELAFERR